MRLLMRVLLLWVVFGFSCLLRAQDAPQPQGEDASTIRVASQFVVLDALVENKKTGSLIGNLQAKDFVLSEDGVAQPITYFSHDQLPLSVVFLFDLTFSVRSALPPLAAGAREILAHLKPQDEVSVMVFSSHTELLQEFTTDRALAADAIGRAAKMKSDDGTFIHESMYEAVGQAMKSETPGSRRVMVWFTDGTANMENARTRKMLGKGAPEVLHTKEEATERLEHSGVVVSELVERTAATDTMVITSNVTPLAFLFGAKLGDIKRYAELTGGPVLDTGKKEAADRLSELIDELRGRYTMGYKPAASKPSGTFCRLQLRLSPDAGSDVPDLHNAVVRTKAGYYR